MHILAVAAISLVAAVLTFFTGFGLGTLLMPAYLVFMPLTLAIAVSAVVHLANNSVKFFLLRKHVNWQVSLSFGLPALVASAAGAQLLEFLSKQPPLFTYILLGHATKIFLVKIIVALVMFVLAMFEISNKSRHWQLSEKLLPAGGFLSGFFGGLCGQQGALRSAFLLKLGLSKESYIASGCVGALMVDVSRIAIYWPNLLSAGFKQQLSILGVSCLCALLGTVLGSKLLHKVQLRLMEMSVASALAVISFLLALGVL